MWMDDYTVDSYGNMRNVLDKVISFAWVLIGVILTLTAPNVVNQIVGCMMIIGGVLYGRINDLKDQNEQILEDLKEVERKCSK